MNDPCKALAERLDALAAQVRRTLETPAQIAARLGGDASALRKQRKEMVRGRDSAAARGLDLNDVLRESCVKRDA